MSVAGRLRDGVKSGAGSTWTAAKRAAVKVAIAAAIVVLVVAMTERGEDTAAAEPSDSRAALGETHAIEAQAALLTDEQVHEQLMLCRYRVQATFGVSVFTDTRMSAKRLVRLYNGEELAGSCFTTEGGDTIGCAGLSWENQWIRVATGTTAGWSPVSCFEKVGLF